jgi:hypothetical protein
MRYLIIVLALLAIPQTSNAQSATLTDIVAMPEDAPTTTAAANLPAQRGYTIRTPLKTIAADPAGAEVINNDVPGLLSDSHYSIIRGMSLKAVAALSGGEITDQMLSQTETDLEALSPPTRVSSSGQ